MTGFDETVPPDLDPDNDATSAQDVGDNVVKPDGAPAQTDADDERAPAPDGPGPGAGTDASNGTDRG